MISHRVRMIATLKINRNERLKDTGHFDFAQWPTNPLTERSRSGAEAKT